jgi:release factor glutamine methyltransferase
LTEPVADTFGSILAEAAAALSAAGFDEPRRRARRLVAASLDLSPTELLSHPERPLERFAVERLRGSVARIVVGEPISRVVGWREFWGLRFALSADTLDPRPESETLVEAVLRRIADRCAPLNVLDLGTGTGCLLLALLSEFPAAIGIGVDIAAGAVMTARENAMVLGLAGRARFVVGDWSSALSGRFTVIVANPPYIASVALAGLAPEVRRYDPRRAVDGGEEGLAAYRRIAKDLPALLANGGIFAGEIGAGQAPPAAAMLKAGGLSIDGIERDLAGIERCIVVRLDESDRGQASSTGQKDLGMCRPPV